MCNFYTLQYVLLFQKLPRTLLKLIYHNIILATKTWGYHKFTTGINGSTDNFLFQRDCDQDFLFNNKMTVPDASR